MLKHNHYVGYFGHDPHQQGDVWMAQDCLHHYFVLDFREQVIRDRRVENLLDRNWRAVQCALVDDAEAALADLLAELEVLDLYLAHAWHRRQSAILDRNLAGVLCELGKALLVQLLLEALHLVEEALLRPLLVAELVLELAHFVSARSRHGPVHAEGLATEACGLRSVRAPTLVEVLAGAAKATIHPVLIVILGSSHFQFLVLEL